MPLSAQSQNGQDCDGVPSSFVATEGVAQPENSASVPNQKEQTDANEDYEPEIDYKPEEPGPNDGKVAQEEEEKNSNEKYQKWSFQEKMAEYKINYRPVYNMLDQICKETDLYLYDEQHKSKKMAEGYFIQSTPDG